jgi:hypothetical protein
LIPIYLYDEQVVTRPGITPASNRRAPLAPQPIEVEAGVVGDPPLTLLATSLTQTGRGLQPMQYEVEGLPPHCRAWIARHPAGWQILRRANGTISDWRGHYRSAELALADLQKGFVPPGDAIIIDDDETRYELAAVDANHERRTVCRSLTADQARDLAAADADPVRGQVWIEVRDRPDSIRLLHEPPDGGAERLRTAPYLAAVSRPAVGNARIGETRSTGRGHGADREPGPKYRGSTPARNQQLR